MSRRRRHARENPTQTTMLYALGGLAALGGVAYYFASKNPSTGGSTAGAGCASITQSGNTISYSPQPGDGCAIPSNGATASISAGTKFNIVAPAGSSTFLVNWGTGVFATTGLGATTNSVSTTAPAGSVTTVSCSWKDASGNSQNATLVVTTSP